MLDGEEPSHIESVVGGAYVLLHFDIIVCLTDVMPMLRLTGTFSDICPKL